ncbi:MAG: substrate-binding domain-containing protein [Candidatus Limiplasma sp.]|nr:substrate-binding domain-containing protein [Candidatus Limiplasma sp.]
MKKRMLAAMMAVMLCVATFGVAFASDKPTIMYVAPKVNDPVWLVAKAGFDAAAEEFGFEGIWTGADDHTVEKTVESLESIIVQQPDAIITCPFAPSAFTNALQKAKDAGIVVTCAAVDAEREDLRNAFVGTDVEAAGIEHIQRIIALLPEGAQVKLGVIMSNIDSENQVRQVNAAEKYMQENNIDYEILDRQADNADPIEAVDKVTAMLRANPEMNAIMSVEGGGTPGVGKAIEEMGLQGKVVAICMDGTEPNLEQVKTGRISGVMAQNVFRWGYDTAKYAVMALKGEEVPSVTDSGVVFVGAENVDTYDATKQ